MKRWAINMLLVQGLSALCFSGTAAAQAYPSRPIRFIVPSAPGGALDLTTRLVAQKMSEKLGQAVIVDNRPGGDTLIGTRGAKAAPADGYTVLATATTYAMLPLTKADPGFDLKDFTGVGFMTRSPLLLNVGAGQPDRTLADLIARAKKEKLTFASGGPAAPPNVACSLFLKAAGIEVTSVPYKGNGPGLLDVIANRVDMICDGYISSAQFIKAGQLRPLAVTSKERIAPQPEVPTFIEQGVNFSFDFWLGLLVKTGTPKEAVDKLSAALKYAL
jgi:tripartite-type tricarboxylate transporter receptor subunit TctC